MEGLRRDFEEFCVDGRTYLQFYHILRGCGHCPQRRWEGSWFLFLLFLGMSRDGLCGNFPPSKLRHGRMGGGRAAGVRLEYDSNMQIAQLVSSCTLVLQSHRFWVKFSKHKGPILSPKRPKLPKNVILLYPLISKALQNLYASTY